MRGLGQIRFWWMRHEAAISRFLIDPGVCLLEFRGEIQCGAGVFQGFFGGNVHHIKKARPGYRFAPFFEFQQISPNSGIGGGFGFEFGFCGLSALGDEVVAGLAAEQGNGRGFG
jgi:hypothetical protein